MFKTLACNKTISISMLTPEVKQSLTGIARFVDNHGSTKGFFVDLKAWQNLLEDIETSSPKFLALMKDSIASGRISGKKVAAELGL